MEQETLSGFVNRILVQSFVTALSMGLLLWVSVGYRIGLGLFSGALVSMVNFRLMAADASGIIERKPGKARRYVVGRVLLRFGIMIGFLAVIAVRTELNIIAAACGLFLVQAVLVVGNMITGYWNSNRPSKG